MASFEELPTREQILNKKREEEAQEMEKYIGKVLLDLREGVALRWLGETKPDVREGDVLTLKIHGVDALKITIGTYRDITQPVSYEWLSRDIPPKKSETVCEVYRAERNKT